MNQIVKTEEKQILLSKPASNNHTVLSNDQGHAVNVVEESEKELLKNNVVDADREVMEDINLLTDEKSLVLNPFYYEENVSGEEELLESYGVKVNKEGIVDSVDQELMEDVKVDERKSWNVESNSKVREEVKKSSGIQMSTSVSMVSLENNGLEVNLENCLMKAQIIMSSDFKGSKGSEEDEKNVKAIKMHETGKYKEGLKGGGKQITKLTMVKGSESYKPLDRDGKLHFDSFCCVLKSGR